MNLFKIIYSTLRELKYEFYFKKIAFPKFLNATTEDLKGYEIKSIVQTSRELVDTEKSMARFGDGELAWMFNNKKGRDNFEKSSKKLSKRLKEVFDSDESGLIITIPDAFKYLYTNRFVDDSSRFWKCFIVNNRRNILNNLNKGKTYYNTSVTRPYMDYNRRDIAEEDFKNLMSAWQGKKVFIIEGEQSRLGTNDDLFDNTKEIKRLECPSKNAFEYYDEILSNAESFLKENKDFLTLISLGPTATILSYDLFKKGYRSLDVGHIDVEYEWFLMGAKEKVNLPYKYVNEAKNGKTALPINNEDYDKQIIGRVNTD
ncbi:MAG: GT-D fold domain-containing glycosyltransferase [Staphylococcus epidermidis]|nr:GT-D fold domain-containing glycosyltransferase [Staphylococcus epidermidis]